MQLLVLMSDRIPFTSFLSVLLKSSWLLLLFFFFLNSSGVWNSNV